MGIWASGQTQGGTELRQALLNVTPANFTANVMPPALQDRFAVRPPPMLAEIKEHFVFESRPLCLDEADQSAYNIVLFGKTGVGKSRLINLLFNQEVAESKGGLHTCTRAITVHRGRAMIGNTNRRVNMIDTIGFGDTFYPPEKIFPIVEGFFQSTLSRIEIDCVLIVESGRLSGAHIEALLSLKEYLKENKNPLNFSYVYTHADELDEKERALAVEDVLTALRACNPSTCLFYNQRRVPKCLAVGLSPAQQPQRLAKEVERVREMVLGCGLSGHLGRVCVSKSSCAIS